MKSKLMNIPVTKIAAVEKIVGRDLARNQTPQVKVRVPLEFVEQVKAAVSND